MLQIYYTLIRLIADETAYGIISFMQPTIIGVRFTRIVKVYHFDSSAMPDVGVGEHVIVDTSRGKHLGEVIQKLDEARQKALEDKGL
jgi:hypothetical protein